jgi:hypothetical protein
MLSDEQLHLNDHVIMGKTGQSGRQDASRDVSPFHPCFCLLRSAHRLQLFLYPMKFFLSSNGVKQQPQPNETCILLAKIIGKGKVRREIRTPDLLHPKQKSYL